MKNAELDSVLGTFPSAGRCDAAGQVWSRRCRLCLAADSSKVHFENSLNPEKFTGF
jgi:hypothetical protein